MERGSSNVNGLRNTHLQKRQQANDKTRSTTLNLDVLDCPICVESFTIPIFQCSNGHLACASCCPKLSNKCPSCALPIGYIRCRALETILESVFVPCQYKKFGCTKTISYGKQSTHEKECSFSPCSCPVRNCDYIGFYKDIYGHYKTVHQGSYMFNGLLCDCDTSFSFPMNIWDNILVKREYKMKLLFVVQCFREPYGVYVTVSCIASSAPEVGEFSYKLSYIVDGHTMIYKSPEVKKVLQLSFQNRQENSMLIPNSLLRGEVLDMILCINKLN